jgi:VCBS repeat protein/FG-GAP repeat protein
MSDLLRGLGVWLGLVTLAGAGCKTYTVAPNDGGSDASLEASATGDAPSDGTRGTGGAPALDAGADSAPDGSLDTTSRPDVTTANDAAVVDAVADGGPDLSKIAPPRLIAPLSTATVTSRRPLLHWVLPSGTDGAHVEICHDRACTNPIVAFDTTGAVGAPAADLPPGVVFWHAFGRAGGLTGTTSTPTWQFNVGARSAPVNTSWGTTLDLNGDGYADVVVGGDQVSRAYIYMGSPAGIASAQQPIKLSGPAGSRFGISVASAGDVNGDGYADLLVGAFGDLSQVGSIYVYLGSASGISASSQPIMVPGPDGQNSNFGQSTASAGDLNGDGYADILVGAPAVGGGIPLGTGRAHIYFGGPSGPTSSSRIDLNGPDGGLFGSSVASAGDINGDGYSDFVIGASYVLSATGRAYIYLGGSSGVSSGEIPTTSLTGPGGPNGSFGSATNTGDVNGDGYADLLVGTSTGLAYVYIGGSQGIPSTQQPTTLGNASSEVSSAGDINGDGYADIIAGNVVYQGSAVGVSTARSITLANPDNAGGTATGVGDLNGDGYADVATGNDGYMDCLGRVYIYTGSAAGFTATQQPVILTGPDIDDEFGISIAALGPATSGRTGC